MTTDLHCDNNANHRYSSADHTPGQWCPVCGEGAALRMDAPAEPESDAKTLGRLSVLIEGAQEALKSGDFARTIKDLDRMGRLIEQAGVPESLRERLARQGWTAEDLIAVGISAVEAGE